MILNRAKMLHQWVKVQTCCSHNVNPQLSVFINLHTFSACLYPFIFTRKEYGQYDAAFTTVTAAKTCKHKQIEENVFIIAPPICTRKCNREAKSMSHRARSMSKSLFVSFQFGCVLLFACELFYPACFT